MKHTPKFVGLDVHKDTIAVGIAEAGRGDARYWGEIGHRPEAVRKLIKRLGRPEDLIVCYEAGPTGYGLYRQLRAMGITCIVVAPTLTPTRPGDRVKTDRRDAVRLAKLLRAGELTPVWVPNEADEALRDLMRAREDAKQDLTRARQRLSKFLLRHDLRGPEGVRRWGRKHREWLDGLRFQTTMEQLVFQEYLHAIDEIEARIKRLEEEIHRQATTSDHAPVIQALQALKGVAEVTATALVAEVQSFSRFSSPAQLMSYAGLVPKEHSSGGHRWQGGITKTGNAHLRRVLIEAAWSYRYRPSLRARLRKRQEGQPRAVRDIAWRAQHRLHHKYVRMVARGKPKPVAVTGVARELLGFIWEIACRVEADRSHPTAA